MRIAKNKRYLENTEYYKIHGNTYRRTFKGRIVHMYAAMKRRVSGDCQRPHIYNSLPICTKEEFYTLANASAAYTSLYNTWKDSNYNKKLTPSVNRIRSNEGYTLDNIEFITLSKNCQLGQINSNKKRFYKDVEA